MTGVQILLWDPSEKMQRRSPARPESRHSADLAAPCAALGAGGRLGFMEVKSDISPQPPGVRSHLRRGCERETGLLGDEDVGLKAV